MDDATQEGATGQHRGAAGNRADPQDGYAHDPLALEVETGDLACEHINTGCRNRARDEPRIAISVSLNSGPMDRRPLASVQQAELDRRMIRRPSHHTIEGIDLSNQMSLADAADCRIAGHLAKVESRHRHQSHRRAHPVGGQGAFNTRVPSTDYDHVVLFHVKPIFQDRNG